MKCNECSDVILRYVDGQTNDIEEVKMRNHIKICKECAYEYNAVVELLEALDNELSVEPPDDFEKDVMKKIKDFEEGKLRRRFGVLLLLCNILFLGISAIGAAAFNMESGWAYDISHTIITYFLIIPELMSTFLNNIMTLYKSLEPYISIAIAAVILISVFLLTLLISKRNTRIADIMKQLTGRSIIVSILMLIGGVAVIAITAIVFMIPLLYIILIGVFLVLICLGLGEMTLFRFLRRTVYNKS